MRERNKKATLEQIRTLFPFDVATLAEQAGVTTDTLYYALLLRPIAQQDAERIFSAASQHSGLALSSDNVDIVTWEEFLILWLIRASKHNVLQQQELTEDRYTFVYARNRDHATLLTRNWLESMPDFPHHFFMPCGDGFQVEDMVVPGYRHIEEAERQG